MMFHRKKAGELARICLSSKHGIFQFYSRTIVIFIVIIMALKKTSQVKTKCFIKMYFFSFLSSPTIERSKIVDQNVRD